MPFIQPYMETSSLLVPVVGTENISENAAVELLVFNFLQICSCLPLALFACSSLNCRESLSPLALALLWHWV